MVKPLAIAVVAGLAACASRPVPLSPVQPSPDSYQHAGDQDPAVRAHAAAELADDPHPHAVEVLRILTERDGDPGVRIAATTAIADRRDPALDPMLEHAAASDADPAVRGAALTAHARLWPLGKDPRVAAGLSLVCPGCGQIYLHQRAEGAAELVATAALLGGGTLLAAGHPTNPDGTADSATVPIGTALALAGQNLWFYSIFDAYRSARVLRHDEGYSFAISRESLPSLAAAPFTPSVLASPWVWAGVPAMLAAGLGVTYLSDRHAFTANPSIGDVKDVNVFGSRMGRAPGFAAGGAYFASLFASVGVGEESLFRGLIQTEMEERFGTYGGLAIASAIFGAVHFVNFATPGADPKQALVALPTIAVLGSTMGLAYIHTGHQLRTGVAMHFWYDTLLSLASFALDPTHQPFVVQMSSTTLKELF